MITLTRAESARDIATIKELFHEYGASLGFELCFQNFEAELAGEGRIVVRPSGTEPALRVMVEGRDAVRVLRLADELAALAAERLNQDR